MYFLPAFFDYCKTFLHPDLPMLASVSSNIAATDKPRYQRHRAALLHDAHSKPERTFRSAPKYGQPPFRPERTKLVEGDHRERDHFPLRGPHLTPASTATLVGKWPIATHTHTRTQSLPGPSERSRTFVCVPFRKDTHPRPRAAKREQTEPSQCPPLRLNPSLPRTFCRGLARFRTRAIARCEKSAHEPPRTPWARSGVNVGEWEV